MSESLNPIVIIKNINHSRKFIQNYNQCNLVFKRKFIQICNY